MEDKEGGGCRVTRSDPDFEKIFKLANDLAIAKNPQRWFNLVNREVQIEGGLEGETVMEGGMDLGDEERLAVVAEIERQLGEAIADVASLPLEFREFLATLE